jgi:hypothetical protein
MKLIKVKNVYKDQPMWLNAEKILSMTKSVENKMVIYLDDRNVFEVEESEQDILDQIHGVKSERKKTK